MGKSVSLEKARVEFKERDLSSMALAVPTQTEVEMQGQKLGSRQGPLSRDLHSSKDLA